MSFQEYLYQNQSLIINIYLNQFKGRQKIIIQVCTQGFRAQITINKDNNLKELMKKTMKKLNKNQEKMHTIERIKMMKIKIKLK